MVAFSFASIEDECLLDDDSPGKISTFECFESQGGSKTDNTKRIERAYEGMDLLVCDEKWQRGITSNKNVYQRAVEPVNDHDCGDDCAEDTYQP